MSNKRYVKANSHSYDKKHFKPATNNHSQHSGKSRESFCNIPNRNIYFGKTHRIISKDDLKRSDLDKLEIVIPLNNSGCNFPHNYSLANIPNTVEKAKLQSYHFSFSKEQLGAMFTCPKVAVDRFHNTYVYNNEVMHRTSFYLIAPNRENNFHKDPKMFESIINESEIPILYRFSISRNLTNKEHYSISMYALVGGAEDGWLFLARLDNNNQLHHDFITDSTTKASYFKKHSAIPVCEYDEKHQKMLQVFSEMFGDENNTNMPSGIIHRIAFPHIHQADSSYEPGDEPETSCPKFLKKCASNTLEENVAFMMKAFHISETPEFYSNNESIEKIVSEKRNCIKISSEPKSDKFIKEMLILENCNSMRDFELVKPKEKVGKEPQLSV